MLPSSVSNFIVDSSAFNFAVFNAVERFVKVFLYVFAVAAVKHD